MPDPVLREMTADDYDDVITLWRADPGVGLSDADSREGIASHLRRNPGMSVVAHEGDELVGAVMCGHDGRRGYVTHLAVAASHRRRGIGGLMTGWCIDRLRECGIDKCHVLVFRDNDAARAYYRTTGWTERTELVVMSRHTDPGDE